MLKSVLFVLAIIGLGLMIYCQDPESAFSNTVGTPEQEGWILQFSDNFNRVEPGTNWSIFNGQWSVKNGMLVGGTGESVVICNRKFPGSQRLEFEAASDNPGDLSGLLGINKAYGYPSGYFFGFGSGNNVFSQLLSEGVLLQRNDNKVIIPGKLHHVVCQRDDNKLTHLVDGEVVATCTQDTPPLKGPDHEMIGFYIYLTGRIDNVKVYTKPEPIVSGTNKKMEGQQSTPTPGGLATNVSRPCSLDVPVEKLITANPHSWYGPDRAAKVAALIPGRKVPMPSPDEFMADWTRKQVGKWEKAHGPLPGEDGYTNYSVAEPSDQELTAFIPDHISPFGRVLDGNPDRSKVAGVMITYCPFCGHQTAGSKSIKIVLDPKNPFHAVTPCCHQDLYEREQDFPSDYKLRPNSSVQFVHLDNTVKEVPAYTFTDKEGVKWQLFIGTAIAHERWGQVGWRSVGTLNRYRETGDPVYVHKLAVTLDRVADVYYGLPLSYQNELAKGKDGGPLTRAEWEALPRPVLKSRLLYGGLWNRRSPLFNRGWLFQGQEYVWVEPFARVRHHPVFKNYSRKKYGDPEALDRKIMTKLMREIALMFASVQLVSDYQDGSYTELMMLGILLKDRYLFDFAAAHQECLLYNHHYYDGMNGEGAPNYMEMLRTYYGYMTDPKGWLEFAPNFLQEHPFFGPASTEWKKVFYTGTVRGLPLEFGDEHIYAFDPRFISDAEQVKVNEKRPSLNWPGYGFGILRVGGPGHRQEVSMNYNRARTHGATDKLGIECWVDGVPVMREGGYAASSCAIFLDQSRPEIKTLLSLPYPHPMFDVTENNTDFDRNWVHEHLSHNTASVNEFGPGRGWFFREGFGDLVTYKGGEMPGELGASFQVLDCRDLYSFKCTGVEVEEFRRALLAVEGPDGRPYVVDIFRIKGGQRQALFYSGWAERSQENLPMVKSVEPNLAIYLDNVRKQPSSTLPLRKFYEQIREVKIHGGVPEIWGLTWKTDYAAYAPRDAAEKDYRRPLPNDVGMVNLRLIGIRQKKDATLLSGKGPWIARIKQTLPSGTSVDGNVGFRDAWDYLIETRNGDGAADSKPLNSTFLNILEGYRKGEESAIKNVTQLALADTPTAPEGVVGLTLEMAGGHTDTVVFLPYPGNVQFKNGLKTDARYALVRQDSEGKILEVNMVQGTTLEYGKFSVQTSGEFKGTIVDLIGDLTGTRLESALIVRPDTPWPLGAGLAGKQILIEVINHHREAYTIEKVTEFSGGLLRVDLTNHAPFAYGWCQVSFLDPNKPKSLTTKRPLSAGLHTYFGEGCKAWFPELGRTYTIKSIDRDSGTAIELVENVDLTAEGIKPGDWFLIHAIEPGLKVTVPGEFVWRQNKSRESRLPSSGQQNESAGYRLRAIWRYLQRHLQSGPVVYRLRTTDTATVTIPAVEGDIWARVGAGKWQKLNIDLHPGQRTMTLTFPGNTTGGQEVWLLTNKPECLKLEDSGPPQITKLFLDGKALEPKSVIELGRTLTPQTLEVEAKDKNNPIDERSIVLTLDGKKIDNGLNHDFEASTNLPGWEIADPVFSGEIKIVSRPEVEPHSGKNCLSITPDYHAGPDDNYRTIVYTPAKFRMEYGDEIKFTFWVKGAVSGPGATRPSVSEIFKEYDADGERGQTLCWWGTYVKEAPETWSEYTSELSSDQIEKVYGKTAGIAFDIIGKGTVYLDDISIKIKRSAKSTIKKIEKKDTIKE